MSTYVDGCLQYKKMGDQIKNSKFSKKKKEKTKKKKKKETLKNIFENTKRKTTKKI